MGHPRIKVSIRWRDNQAEAQCPTCRDWWPTVSEFWAPPHGMSRCRACWREYHRLHQAGRMQDEIIAELTRAGNRARYAMNRQRKLDATKRWRERNREHVAAYGRAYREAHKDELRAKRRLYEAECRDVILLKKRRAYVEKKVRDAA